MGNGYPCADPLKRHGYTGLLANLSQSSSPIVVL